RPRVQENNNEEEEPIVAAAQRSATAQTACDKEAWGLPSRTIATRLTRLRNDQPSGKWHSTPAAGMYEAPESRAREARGTHRDVGRTDGWWWQRLEGQQEPGLGQQGLEESRIRLQEPRLQERVQELLVAAAIGRPGQPGRPAASSSPAGETGAGIAAGPRLRRYPAVR